MWQRLFLLGLHFKRPWCSLQFSITVVIIIVDDIVINVTYLLWDAKYMLGFMHIHIYCLHVITNSELVINL